MEFTTDDECTGQRARRQIIKYKLQEVDVNVQKIISNNKSESMFELRKLTHHQRPVSAFDRQTLEVFLSTRQQSFHKAAACPEIPQHSGSSSVHAEIMIQPSGAQETSLNVSERVQQLIPLLEPSHQNLMPDEIRLDVQNLLERHIVHEVLQGQPAQEIERTLRQGIEQRHAHRRPRPRPSSHFQQAEDGDEGEDEVGRGPIRPVGRLVSSTRTFSRRGRTSPRNRHVRFVPQLPIPDAEGHYPIRNRDQSIVVDQLRQSPALNSLGTEDMDKIVDEVSNLVSQRLVTSALSGEFRGTLELHIQSRVQQINRDQVGLRRMQVHQHQHQEQEFSNDERQPLASAQLRELHEEMMSMKGQLRELKQLVKLSFNLQLDIQRAIRQEVAATLASALSQQNIAEGGGAEVHTCPLPTLTPSGRSFSLKTDGHRSVNVVDSGRCVICSEGVIDSVIYHCGHMCTCISCGMELKSKALKCPICRAPITDVIRAYTSML